MFSHEDFLDKSSSEQLGTNLASLFLKYGLDGVFTFTEVYISKHCKVHCILQSIDHQHKPCSSIGTL